LLSAIISFSYQGLSSFEGFISTNPFSIESILNPEPVSTESSGSQGTGDSGGGSGGGSGGNSSSIDTIPMYDTTKLANHLEKYVGHKLHSTNLLINKNPSELKSSYHNISRIFANVKLENPSFFNKNLGGTMVNSVLIRCIRDLNKNYT
jgi:hypothetical protein